MTVYFIAAEGEGDPIKIGFTDNLERRLRELQNTSPKRLAVLAAVEGDRDLEQRMHEYLRDERQWGEWFTASPRLKGFLEVVMAAAGGQTICAASTMLLIIELIDLIPKENLKQALQAVRRARQCMSGQKAEAA